MDNNLILNITRWAEERNIINGSSVERETLKLISTSGRLTNFIEEKDVCSHGIGDAVIQMLILCRMKGIAIQDSLKFTNRIKDERIADPHIALIMIMKYLGELSADIYNGNDFKVNIGYLLIYIMALSLSLELSIMQCTVKAFLHIKDDKYIIFNGNSLDETHEHYESAKKIVEAAKAKRSVD